MAEAPVPASAPAPTWRVVVLIAVAVLLLGGGLLAWWVWRRRLRAGVETAGSAPGSRRALRLTFLAAARGSDVAAQSHALLDWARAERPGLTGLGALAEALASDTQREAIEALQRRRFAADANVPAPDLAMAFRGGFQWREPPPGGEPPLPPLYPFKLR